jgi:hypothetical protein
LITRRRSRPLVAYKLKRFPAPFDAPWLEGATQSCAFILAANWCMQGVRGMDRKELAFRLLLEAVAAALLTAALQPWTPGLVAAVPALALAHTLSFTLNGQVWVCVRYCRWYARDPAAVAGFARASVEDLRRLPWLEEAAVIGSRAASDPAWGPRSDIDLRLVTAPGLSGWLRTNLLLFRLRAAAFLRAIPLDLYAYDAPSSLARLNQREPLRVVLDRSGRLAAAFPERVVPA